ncbi:transposase [Vibrio cholerae]|nr:transposase [Vibrio cholerae]
MIKRIFSILLRRLLGFFDYVFMLAKTSLDCSHYSCISQRSGPQVSDMTLSD